MRTIDELISYMDWTDDINYAELLQLKNVYLNNHNLDAFIEAQQAALGMYAEAKDAFSRSHLSIEELHLIQEHLLSNLWHYEK
uniref:Uncharacterized protein n=1 Tax=Siphoviridae sp. ctf8W5 TaxID=2825595 RepID=A0A8S5Q7R6_9CAUD|nr:MAG TPA: hypothetical protein [Siphoviridae sp. ctf8W5]